MPYENRRVRAASSGYSTPEWSPERPGNATRIAADPSIDWVIGADPRQIPGAWPGRFEPAIRMRTVALMSRAAQPSVLFVHAHPDDETIGTGATMARYVAEGVRVTLVTCTLGEEGEISVPELSLLGAGHADQLGGYRIAELAGACAALGVADHRFLGDAGRYRDSGMMGLPSNDHPRAFWRADPDEAAGILLEVIREVRPTVAVTYDPDGFYGHPDHIQAHRVTTRACALAAEAGIAPERVFWPALPRSVIAAGMATFPDTPGNPFSGVDRPDDLPFCCPDEEISVRLDASGYAGAKAAALRAHATQIPPDSWLLSVAGNFGSDPMGVEYYRLAPQGSGAGSAGWSDDLLAGLR
jgi:N-acetyl-1-D-myo-inositol-2-amino-2-deoxy-alpha-D-glucopyranoside deacetylase